MKSAMEIANISSGIDPHFQHEIEQYLYREASFLDRRKWEEWEELFTEDGMYWVPLSPDQKDALNHVSIFYEDSVLRDVRRRRLEHARAWSQQPQTRASRIVGNVIVFPSPSGELHVESSFQMTEWRGGRKQRQLAGHYTHKLVAIGDTWRIRLKRIDLISCDGIHDCFEVFI